MVLPEGVSVDQARTQFNSVNWKAGSGFQWGRENQISVTASNDKELALASQKAVAHDGLPGPKLKVTAHGLIRKLRKMAGRGGLDLKQQTAIEAKGPQVMWGRDHDVVSGGSSSHLSSTGDLDTILDAPNDDPTIDADQNTQLDSRDNGQTTTDLDRPA